MWRGGKKGTPTAVAQTMMMKYIRINSLIRIIYWYLYSHSVVQWNHNSPFIIQMIKFVSIKLSFRWSREKQTGKEAKVEEDEVGANSNSPPENKSSERRGKFMNIKFEMSLIVVRMLNTENNINNNNRLKLSSATTSNIIWIIEQKRLTFRPATSNLSLPSPPAWAH